MVRGYCRMIKLAGKYLAISSLIAWPLLSHGANQLMARSIQHSQPPPQDPREIWQHITPYSATDDTSAILVSFDQDFEFGLATASSQSEDDLDDSWLEHARRGHVRAFAHVADPESRLRFFSNPLTEIQLAAQAGVQIFRMSVNWNRLVPTRPAHTCGQDLCRTIQNRAALQRYKEIFAMVKAHDMKLMLTLFHHDLPKWAIPTYAEDAYTTLGWTNPQLMDHFYDFAVELLEEAHEYVDYVVTFNEPTLFTFLTHNLNLWPSNGQTSSWLLVGLNHLLKIKDFFLAMDQMAEAHRRIYTTLKAHHPELEIGVSHITPYIKEGSELSNLLWNYIHQNAIVYGFPDSIIHHLDFLGINYYGEESLSLFDYSLNHLSQSVYTDSGRILNAGGLYHILLNFHHRYAKSRPTLKYFVTENGLADDTDLVRMPFLIEHLYALAHARHQGVPVAGYVFWTISDNWEWTDGYCPKFGLVHVDRSQDLLRTPKPSYYLYQTITTQRHITENMRHYAHHTLQDLLERRTHDPHLSAHWDGMRGFCRHTNGVHGLDQPIRSPIAASQTWIFDPDDH